MGILTLIRYLIGDRQAILEVATNRYAIWVGMLFVLSAGYAPRTLPFARTTSRSQ